MAHIQTAPNWLTRLNTILLWLNPGLSLVAVVLALLVIAEAGERWPGTRADAAPQIARLVEARSSDLCRPSKLSPELQDLYRYD